jgi:hypothetical protein
MYLHGSMYMDIYFSLIFLKNVGASWSINFALTAAINVERIPTCTTSNSYQFIIWYLQAWDPKEYLNLCLMLCEERIICFKYSTQHFTIILALLHKLCAEWSYKGPIWYVNVHINSYKINRFTIELIHALAMCSQKVHRHIEITIIKIINKNILSSFLQ